MIEMIAIQQMYMLQTNTTDYSLIWNKMKQPTVALSFIEAQLEYTDLSAAAQEIA